MSRDAGSQKRGGRLSPVVSHNNRWEDVDVRLGLVWSVKRQSRRSAGPNWVW